MKKIIAMFVMVMFLMSGVVIAGQGSGSGNGDGSPLSINDKPAKTTYKDTLQLRRQITTQQLQQARQQFLQAKERYLGAKEQYQNRKQEMKEHRENYLECKNSDTAECEQIRTQTRERARLFLMDSADLVLNHIENIRERANSNEDLTEEELADLLAKLDEVEAEINEAKETIENLGDDASKEDIKDASKTIRQALNKVKWRFKHSIARNFGARLRTIIAKAEKAGDRVEEAIGGLEGDTSELDSLVNQYEAYVEEAKEKYEEGKEKWQGQVDPGSVDEVSKGSNALFKGANEALKNAHRILRQIVKDIKEKGSTIGSNGEDDEDDDEDDDGDDDEDDDETED